MIDLETDLRAAIAPSDFVRARANYIEHYVMAPLRGHILIPSVENGTMH